MLRAKSLTINVVADVAGFPDQCINLPLFAILILILILIPNLEICQSVAKRRLRRSPVGQGAFILSKSSLALGGNFMFLPFQMAHFIQLLRWRMTKSGNMLLVCYFSCYRLSR